MKTIEVVAAIIHKDNSILATQRGYGEFEGMWSFLGGRLRWVNIGKMHLK